MEKEKLEILKEILSLPTYFGHEDMIRDYLISFGIENKLKVTIDPTGNVYFTKGELEEGEYFPFVCAHMDSVHSTHIDLVAEKRKKIIVQEDDILTALHPDTNLQTGIAGDDLAGVFMALQMVERFDVIKAGFFVKEEYGCEGSYNCDEEFFDNVGFAIQFDSPGFNRYAKTLMGTDIHDEKFNDVVKPLLDKFEVTNFTHDPYTDIYALKEQFDFCCANLPAGYYNYHSSSEYVKISDLDKSIELSTQFIETLGKKKYQFDNVSFDSDYDYRLI